MKIGYAIWIAAPWLLAGVATAAEPSGGTQQIGPTTQQWLQSQREGKRASDKPQPLSGRVQEQIYERYRKSFSYPVPQYFGRGTTGASAGTQTR